MVSFNSNNFWDFWSNPQTDFKVGVKMDLLVIADSLAKLIFSILLLIQVGIVFFLPPDKAQKFNFLGKGLEILAKTKSGFSVRNDKHT